MPGINFQLDKMSISEKSNFDWGMKLAQDIEGKVNGGMSSYFWVRNQRWKTNRNYAHGKIAMQRFMDLLEFNGKVNYINLNWQCIQIVNRIVSGLVGRWMQRNEKISVKATDSLSEKQKQEEYERLEFFIDYRDQLEALQEQSGVQTIPQEEGMPQDKDELRLWQAQFQRIPEEILYELGINDVLAANGWYDVLKEKMLHDSAETGFVATYTWMDSEGVIHVEWLKPENCFYSYSNYPDFRDTAWRGYMRTMKISELRRKYGKEFGGVLSEEQLFQMAQSAKEYQLYDNITWITEWNVTFLRPYDEWNVDVLEFEYKTVDTESYTVVTTKKNRSTIVKKGRPEKKADNEEVIDDSKINIYRGVYARTTQTMLEWGLKKNMIRPQDPKEMGNAEFSYSFYMVQNYDMTTLGVPEKIQEPADQMIIARLKMQQLVAKMRPIGSAVNWDALQNIDYGLGEGNKTIDVKKLYDQTGDLYWRGKDAEGNPIPVPIVELQNAGFYNQLQGLILLYDKHYAIMKDELGEDPNLMSQALQPRVTEGNVETSQSTAAQATDQYYRAYVECMKDTAKKISCLLKDSVTYGASVYRHIVNEDDLEGRMFSTRIQLLPDAFEIQKFEAMLNNAIMTNQDMIMFINPFQLMQMAKEDVKLAWLMFNQGQKKMLEHRAAEAQQNQEATFKAQRENSITSEEEKRKTMEREMEIEEKRTNLTGQRQNQTAIVNMVTSWLAPSADGTAGRVPPEYQPIVNAVMQNIMVGAVASTEEQKQKIMEEMQEAQMAAQQAQMEQQQDMQPEQNQMPPQAA
jgi:hypothetical protein